MTKVSSSPRPAQQPLPPPATVPASSPSVPSPAVSSTSPAATPPADHFHTGPQAPGANLVAAPGAPNHDDVNPPPPSDPALSQDLKGARLESSLAAAGGAAGKRPLPPPPRRDPGPDIGSEEDAGAWKDAGAPPPVDANDRTFQNTVSTTLRSELNNTRPEAFTKMYDSASPSEKVEIRNALQDSLNRGEFRDYAQKSPENRAKLDKIVRHVAPEDPSIQENVAVNKTVDAMKPEDWKRYPHSAIIVPGYTPLGADKPIQMHPTQRERCVAAKKAYDEGKAPFILVSGANVHPPGNQYYEAVEMKRELRRMGVPEDRIIVDARARHSTTNLRNAARYMDGHNMGDLGNDQDGKPLGRRNAMIVTDPGQEFYYANPGISTFHSRSRAELGYAMKVGPGKYGPELTPTDDVHRTNYGDLMDP